MISLQTASCEVAPRYPETPIKQSTWGQKKKKKKERKRCNIPDEAHKSKETTELKIQFKKNRYSSSGVHLLKTQPHTLTAGSPSDCVGTPRYTAGTWSHVVLSLVPVPTDEGTDVLKEAMGLAQRHTQQGKISICQTPYPVFLARHHCQ